MKPLYFFKKGFTKLFKSNHFFIQLNQRNKNSNKIEKGRSMVEMLGVLAVVGVLSVGGILGYKFAMIKYQANQIVNELNLTSSQIAIMLMRPHTADFELFLGEPYDDGHIATNALAFDFGCGTGAAGEDVNCATDDIEYFSEVQGLPKEVCQNLVQMVHNLPYLEEVLVNDAADETGASCADNSTVRCLFNADQNAVIVDNPDPEETKTSNGYYETTTNSYCRTNEDCVNWQGSYRPVCNVETGQCEGCAADTDCTPFTNYPACYIREGAERGYCVNCTTNNHCQSIDPEYPICNNRNCVQCLTNSDCADKEGLPYCSSSYQCVSECPKGNYLDSNANKCVYGCRTNDDCDTSKTFCNITSHQNYTNLKGYCRSKSTLGEPTKLKTLNITLYPTQQFRGTWWSNKNYCLAHGKKPLSVNGNLLKCYKTDGTPFNIANRDNGRCLKQGSSTELSEPMQEINKIYGGGWYWLDDDIDNSPGAYALMCSGGPAMYGRADSINFAFLCTD